MISSVFTVLILRVFGMLLWLLTTLLLARVLPVEEFALTLLAVNIVLLCGSLATLGGEVALLRFGSIAWRDGKKDLFRGEIRQSVRLALIGGVIAIGVLGSLIYLGLIENQSLTLGILAAIGFGILLSAQIVVHRTALRSAGRIGEAVLAESFLRSFVTLTLAGLAAWLWQLSFGVFFAAYLISLIVGWTSQLYFMSCLALLRGEIGKVPSRVKMALSVWPGDAALTTFQRLPGVVIGFTTELETVAVFLAAERVAQAGMFLIDAVRTVIGPNIAVAKEGERQSAISSGSAIMFVAGCCGFVLTLILGAVFVRLLGDIYHQALPIIVLLLIGQFSFAVLGPTTMILNMFGQERIRSIVVVCATAIVFVCLISATNIYQVAIFYSATIWSMNGILAYFIWRRLRNVTGIFGVRRAALISAVTDVVRTVAAKIGMTSKSDNYPT